MLVQFSVENYLSFDREQVLSLVATKTDQQHPNHLVVGDNNKGGTILRTAAIYGANASGKSNLIQAMRFAQRLITTGVRSEQSLGVRPFRLGDAQGDRLTKFEFVILTNDVLYNYGFRLDSRRVVEEWLFVTKSKSEICLFERTTSRNSEVKISAGAALRGRTKEREQFLQFIAKGMRPNQLFLTEATERNVNQLKPVIDWFRKSLVLISAESQAKQLEVTAHQNKVLTKFLSEFIKTAGTGIESIKTEEIPFDLERTLLSIPIEEHENLRQYVSEIKKDEIAEIVVPSGKHYYLQQGESGKIVQITLRMLHQAEDGREVSFTIDDESDGTRRLIHLMPALFLLKDQQDKTIVLDELDRRFHTHLSRLFLQSALNCDKDHTHSQLIFSTHDTNLLDLDLLRRDEIWFIEKDRRGASNLYSLTEFNIRPDLKVEKGYLNGRFGAIPFISDVNRLGWHGHFESEVADSEQETKIIDQMAHVA